MSEKPLDDAKIFELSTGDFTLGELRLQLDAVQPQHGSLLPAVEHLLELLPHAEDWHEVHRSHTLHRAVSQTLARLSEDEKQLFGDAMIEPTPDDQKASSALAAMQDILDKPLFRTIGREGQVSYSRDPVAEIRQAIDNHDMSFSNALPDAVPRQDAMPKGRSKPHLRVFKAEEGGPSVA